MLKWSLSDCCVAYKLVKWIIAIVGQGTDAAALAADRLNKEVILKNCALFANCISEINNTQIDNAKDLDAVMPTYNLI